MHTRNTNSIYHDLITLELKQWQSAMRRPPNFWNRTTKKVQRKVNSVIPEKIHKAITKAIKEITRVVIFGSKFTTRNRKEIKTLEETEIKVKERINFYSSSAAVEGAATGFGGFLLSLADFPLWLTLKMKMLFEIASRYGYDTKDYKERVYILYIFQLTFSSQEHRNEVFKIMENWEVKKEQLPDDLNAFDWRTFQLEYRDYIDLAKLLQLLPGVGAIAGAFVNHKLTNKLGKTAMNAYRMRDERFREVRLLKE
ncbi:EcsC family protein [Fulvivirga sp. M361]|uniref:EcsC family protein n=1 Tax=Fulvivirga sp. M361 TaxID=2594266 RepID=UPI00117B7934|nr:EcsC family protein [Fulvivirga sp. M361]TRX53051.1 EcsC family protein [Fulvivirga sp. M361]